FLRCRSRRTYQSAKPPPAPIVRARAVLLLFDMGTSCVWVGAARGRQRTLSRVERGDAFAPPDLRRVGQVLAGAGSRCALRHKIDRQIGDAVMLEVTRDAANATRLREASVPPEREQLDEARV